MILTLQAKNLGEMLEMLRLNALPGIRGFGLNNLTELEQAVLKS